MPFLLHLCYKIDLLAGRFPRVEFSPALQLTSSTFFLLLGWSNWKSDLFRERIRQGFCLGCRPKPVSFLIFCLDWVFFPSLKFPWCFRWGLIYRLIKILFLFHSVLLSANYLSRYFDADGREIISKNEVCSSFVFDKFDHSIVDFC